MQLVYSVFSTYLENFHPSLVGEDLRKTSNILYLTGQSGAYVQSLHSHTLHWFFPFPMQDFPYSFIHQLSGGAHYVSGTVLDYGNADKNLCLCGLWKMLSRPPMDRHTYTHIHTHDNFSPVATSSQEFLANVVDIRALGYSLPDHFFNSSSLASLWGTFFPLLAL